MGGRGSGGKPSCDGRMPWCWPWRLRGARRLKRGEGARRRQSDTVVGPEIGNDCGKLNSLGPEIYLLFTVIADAARRLLDPHHTTGASRPEFEMVRFSSLASKLALAFVLVAPISFWQLGNSAYRSWEAYVDTQTLAKQNVGANGLIAGVYEILMERLATNNALLAEQRSEADVLQEIAKRRTAAAAKIQESYHTLTALAFPNKDVLLGELQGAIDKANAYRARVDSELKQAKTGRNPEIAKGAFDALSGLSATSRTVWNAILSSISKSDAEIARLANLRLYGWNLRDIAGFERSQISQAIAGSTRVSADKLTEIAIVRAEVALLWRFLQANLTADDHPAIKKGVELARGGYFAKFQPLADQMLKLSEAGAAYPMSVSQWVNTTTPLLFTLLEVMYGAGEASEAHMAAQVNEARRSLMLSLSLLILAALSLVAAVLIVVRSVVAPLQGMTSAMQEIAEGHFDLTLPGLARKDEVGDMARAVENFKAQAVEKARRDAERTKSEEQRAAAQRKNDMHRIADEFERAVGNIVQAVSSASNELEATASTLTRTAENTQTLAGTVAATSEQSSGNVQSVAAAAEELVSSVNEIARQVQESARIATEAVKQAEKTDARIAQLSQAAGRIGDVVKLITSVAEQTNLLALNATIEAARAGEAGRGFAVVAQEVKALAGQTAKATEEIGAQVAGMQAATSESVTAISEIGAIIGRISEIATAIASAVEQQGATTQEIAGNVQKAAKGTAEVAGKITEVNQGAVETGSGSTQVLLSAKSLAGESNRLKVEVAKFLQAVRAA